jgi:hypothetical protein
MDVATDTNFQDFDIAEIDLRAKDLLSLKGNAEIRELGQRGFHLEIDSLLLDHKRVFNFIPKNFKEGLENLVIDGTSVFSAVVNGKTGRSDEVEFDIKSKLKTNGKTKILTDKMKTIYF